MPLLVSILFLTAATLSAQEPINSRDWINQGVRAFQSADYPAAVAAFQRAVAAEPSNTVAHLYLGNAYLSQYLPGAPGAANQAFADSAGRVFQKALEIDPANRSALKSLGSLAVSQKNWDRAEQSLRKVIELDPADAEAWYSLGFVAWSKWNPAFSAARTAAGLQPTDPGPLPAGPATDALKSQYLAVVESGIDAFHRALAIDPKYDDAMRYLSLLLRGRAHLRATPAEYQRGIAEADSWLGRSTAAQWDRGRSSLPTPLGTLGIQQSMQPVRVPPRVDAIRMVENVAQANRILMVEPVYPTEAKASGTEGSVVLSVLIDARGKVAEIKRQSGPQAFADAAFAAVRQWVYRPVMLNGSPVAVQTTVTVNFKLK